MKAQDHQTAKVKTAVIKMPEPAVNHPINRCTQVQVMAKGIELNTEANTLGGEGCLVDLERMGVFVRHHGLANDQIQTDGGPTNVDWHKSTWDKQSTWGGGAWRTVGHDSLMALINEAKRLKG